MKIAVTGSPGVGKTAVAKRLAKRLKCKAINEREFALNKRIGRIERNSNELVIPLGKLKTGLNKELRKRKKNFVLEGHLLCEIKLNVDYIIVLRVHPELLELRLEHRRYRSEKIMDNVFCEGIDYCKKHALRKYGKKQVIEAKNEKTIKATMGDIINELRKRGAVI